jgi:hypothetical protein
MPATVTVKNLGSEKLENDVKRALDTFFKDRLGDWQVSVLGSEQNDVWELEVKDSDGQTGWDARLDDRDDSGKFANVSLAKLCKLTALEGADPVR